MKYWNCINIPYVIRNAFGIPSAFEDTEVVEESTTDTDADTETIVDGDVIEVEEVEPVEVADENVLSQEYADIISRYINVPMLNQTIQSSAVKVEDAPNNTEHVDENVKESLPEGTSDDVNKVDADTTSPQYQTVPIQGRIICKNTVIVPDTESEVEVSEDTTVDTTTSTLSESIPTPLSHDDLLSGIRNESYDEESSETEEYTDEVETDEEEEDSDLLNDSQLENIINTLNKYETELFEDIPLCDEKMSERFMRRITKTVYGAHFDATEKYEDPPILDPILLMYPLFTENPYEAMGKFWDVIISKVTSEDKEWSDAITNSVINYDEQLSSSEEEN